MQSNTNFFKIEFDLIRLCPRVAIKLSTKYDSALINVLGKKTEARSVG